MIKFLLFKKWLFSKFSHFMKEKSIAFLFHVLKGVVFEDLNYVEIKFQFQSNENFLFKVLFKTFTYY